MRRKLPIRPSYDYKPAWTFKSWTLGLFMIVAWLLSGCSLNTVKTEYISHNGTDYAIHESNCKQAFNGYLCIGEFVIKDKFYCIEAYYPGLK